MSTSKPNGCPMIMGNVSFLDVILLNLFYLQGVPNGIIYTRVDRSIGYGAWEIFQTVINIIDPLCHVPADIQEARAKYTSLLSNRRLLLVVDDVTNINIGKIITPPPSSAVIVISRENSQNISLPTLELTVNMKII